jgi:hypothetical protein
MTSSRQLLRCLWCGSGAQSMSRLQPQEDAITGYARHVKEFAPGPAANADERPGPGLCLEGWISPPRARTRDAPVDAMLDKHTASGEMAEWLKAHAWKACLL